jgi:hypothetical protein
MPVEPNVVDGKFKVLKPRANAGVFKEKIWTAQLKFFETGLIVV